MRFTFLGCWASKRKLKVLFWPCGLRFLGVGPLNVNSRCCFGHVVYVFAVPATVVTCPNSLRGSGALAYGACSYGCARAARTTERDLTEPSASASLTGSVTVTSGASRHNHYPAKRWFLGCSASLRLKWVCLVALHLRPCTDLVLRRRHGPARGLLAERRRESGTSLSPINRD